MRAAALATLRAPATRACRARLLARALVIAFTAWLAGCASKHPAATTPPAAAAGGSREASAALFAPSALAAWWDAHRVALPTAPLLTHADVVDAATRAVDAAAGRVGREVIGRSVEGRDLLHLTVGRGPMPVLLWSQMHGDEPSATPAIFDLLEWIRRERGSAAVQRLEARLTIHLVPMLNPDGAERFVRRNAQGIDINRDALHLQTPEGRALKALRDRVQPVLGFNLHNQNGQTSAGSPPKAATISLLAVAHDAARSDSPRRKVARQTAAIVREALEPLIPGQVGRYSDEFEVRAFGDNLGRWGTAVVLIESGPLADADPDQALVRLNFVALVTALDALASGRAAAHATTAYDTLPLNESNLLSIRVRNATIVAGTAVPPFLGDVGINVSRSLAREPGPRRLDPAARIADIGDLRVYGALEDIDGTGLTVAPAFDATAAEGALLRMPDWSMWRGSTLTVGQPGAVFLLSPSPQPSPADAATGATLSENWRLVRRIQVRTALP
ncbi:MAG: M14 family zinc carboxypeptidase [Vicinamibacteraceae bacterium]